MLKYGDTTGIDTDRLPINSGSDEATTSVRMSKTGSAVYITAFPIEYPEIIISPCLIISTSPTSDPESPVRVLHVEDDGEFAELVVSSVAVYRWSHRRICRVIVKTNNAIKKAPKNPSIAVKTSPTSGVSGGEPSRNVTKLWRLKTR